MHRIQCIFTCKEAAEVGSTSYLMLVPVKVLILTDDPEKIGLRFTTYIRTLEFTCCLRNQVTCLELSSKEEISSKTIGLIDS